MENQHGFKNRRMILFKKIHFLKEITVITQHINVILKKPHRQCLNIVSDHAHLYNKVLIFRYFDIECLAHQYECWYCESMFLTELRFNSTLFSKQVRIIIKIRSLWLKWFSDNVVVGHHAKYVQISTVNESIKLIQRWLQYMFIWFKLWPKNSCLFCDKNLYFTIFTWGLFIKNGCNSENMNFRGQNLFWCLIITNFTYCNEVMKIILTYLEQVLQ